jgi:hypothetical protein
MLFVSKLPKNLWSVAIKAMTYLKNQSLTQANNGQMPIECLTGQKLDLSHL